MGIILCGKTIKIKGVNFTIVGTLESMMDGAEGTNDDCVLIPVNVAQRTLKIKNITMFIASATKKETVDLNFIFTFLLLFKFITNQIKNQYIFLLKKH